LAKVLVFHIVFKVLEKVLKRLEKFITFFTSTSTVVLSSSSTIKSLPSAVLAASLRSSGVLALAFLLPPCFTAHVAPPLCVNMDETPTPTAISVEGGDRQTKNEQVHP
jgi:hypothetical protein